MIAPYIAYGSTQFPTGTSVESIDRGRTIGVAKLARYHGMRQTSGYRNGIRVALNVPIYKGPLDMSAHEARLDSLRVMLAAGPANLYVGYSDRYYRCCEPASEPETIPATGLTRIHDVQVTMIGPDPYLYSTTSETDTWTPSSGVARAVTATGNTSAAPQFSLTVGGAGAQTIAWTISNDTRSESFTLTGTVTGGSVIIVKTLPSPSCKIGTTDYLTLFEGLFPALSVGSNNITITWTSGSVSSVTMTWTPRYE